MSAAVPIARMLRRAAATAGLVAASLCPAPPLAGLAQAQMQGVELEEPVPVAPFALSDQQGRPFTEQSLKGKWTLMALGFTYCPDVCPFVLASLQGVTEEMSLRASPNALPRVVFLSVDPERDEEMLAEYMEAFNPEFYGITGARDQIDTLVESLDGFYKLLKKSPEDDDYEVQHSASVAVIDPEGRIRAKLQPPFGPGPSAEFLTRLAIEYRRAVAAQAPAEGEAKEGAL